MTKTHCNICDSVMPTEPTKVQLPTTDARYNMRTFYVFAGDSESNQQDICLSCIIKAMRYKRLISPEANMDEE